MLIPPTRRVNVESVKESKYRDKQIISDSCALLSRIKDSYHDFPQNIMIGGLVGCKGDAYCGNNPLGFDESYSFHRNQALQFQKENINFLFAGIMPEMSETRGIAKAMADTEIPYIISFMIHKNGCMIDGTPISEAIGLIDDQVTIKPVCYMTNCVHPTNLIQALSNEINRDRSQLNRFKGIQANASILSPEELNNSTVLHQDDYNHIIEEMCSMYTHFGLKIFSGCCGTDDKFLDNLSRKMIRIKSS